MHIKVYSNLIFKYDNFLSNKIFQTLKSLKWKYCDYVILPALVDPQQSHQRLHSLYHHKERLQPIKENTIINKFHY